MLKRFVTSLLLVGLLGLGFAQDYPTRPITMIVPWAAGGGTDLVARALASAMERELGQSVTVVNRTGGGGVVGHLAIAQASPDGYTIGLATVEIVMLHWQGLTDLTYEDLEPISLVNLDPAAINVRADAPWQTLEELIEEVRANPGQYNASGTGVGGIWDLARAGFLEALDLPVDAVPWVPSLGAAPALAELVAGGIDICTCSLAEAGAMVRAGEVRALAVMADERLPQFPDVPTLGELDIDWSIGAWRGVMGPAGLPAEVVDRLEAAIAVAVEDPEFVELLEQGGFGIQHLVAEDFAAFLAESDATMGEVLRAVGLAE